MVCIACRLWTKANSTEAQTAGEKIPMTRANIQYVSHLCKLSPSGMRIQNSKSLNPSAEVILHGICREHGHQRDVTALWERPQLLRGCTEIGNEDMYRTILAVFRAVPADHFQLVAPVVWRCETSLCGTAVAPTIHHCLSSWQHSMSQSLRWPRNIDD